MALSLRRLAKDFRREIREDHIGQGAAALAFYWMLSLFPAAIFLLTLLAYLPFPNLEHALMHFARTTLPDDAGALLSSFVENVLTRRRGGLLSFGAVLTVWSTSSGIHALMHQLNVAWDVDERRPYWKRRGVALLIALCFALLVIGAFGLVVFGRGLHLRLLRWSIICIALLVGIALIYHYGPNVRRRFRLVTPGSLLALAMLLPKMITPTDRHWAAAAALIGSSLAARAAPARGPANSNGSDRSCSNAKTPAWRVS